MRDLSTEQFSNKIYLQQLDVSIDKGADVNIAQRYR